MKLEIIYTVADESQYPQKPRFYGNLLVSRDLSVAVDCTNLPKKTLLEDLLAKASKQWGVAPEEIQKAMDKIAFHESKGVVDAIQKSDKNKTGIGPGRGLFQFEVGKNEGAHTAINRLMHYYDKAPILEEPDWLTSLANNNYDVSGLSESQQQELFLAEALQEENKGVMEGYDRAGLYDINNDMVISDDELANYWAQYHHAGTKPGTDEYKDMLSTFTEDLQEGYREDLISK